MRCPISVAVNHSIVYSSSIFESKVKGSETDAIQRFQQKFIFISNPQSIEDSKKGGPIVEVSDKFNSRHSIGKGREKYGGLEDFNECYI